MKRIMMVGMAAVINVACAMAFEPEVQLSVDTASAYVFRGATLNDGFVLQPSMESAIGSLAFGVWGNIDMEDYGGTLQKNQFSEVDLYASYALPVEFMDISLDYCEYTYPGKEGKSDREGAVSFGLDVILSPALTVAYGVDGGIRKNLYIELATGYELALGENATIGLEAVVGYLDPDEGEKGFSHYSASLGCGVGPVFAGVTYVGQIDDDVLPDGKGAYDVEVYGMLGFSHVF